MRRVVLSLLLLVALFASATLAKRLTATSSSCTTKCAIQPRTAISDASLKAIDQCIKKCSRTTAKHGSSLRHRAAQALDRMTLQWDKLTQEFMSLLDKRSEVHEGHDDSSLSDSSSSATKCSLYAFRNIEWYKQCDARWKDEKIGFSTKSICLDQTGGSLVTSLAMALNSAWPRTQITPSTLIKEMRHYVNMANMWKVTDHLGWKYQGEITKGREIFDTICSSSNKLILLNMKDSGRWVFVTGISDDLNDVLIRDPGSTRTSITLNEVAKAIVLQRY